MAARIDAITATVLFAAYYIVVGVLMWVNMQASTVRSSACSVATQHFYLSSAGGCCVALPAGD
jgi:Na+/H+ antiporter NhaA